MSVSRMISSHCLLQRTDLDLRAIFSIYVDREPETRGAGPPRIEMRHRLIRLSRYVCGILKSCRVSIEAKFQTHVQGTRHRAWQGISEVRSRPILQADLPEASAVITFLIFCVDRGGHRTNPSLAISSSVTELEDLSTWGKSQVSSRRNELLQEFRYIKYACILAALRGHVTCNECR